MFVNLFSLERSQTWQNKKPLIMNEACLRATGPGFLSVIWRMNSPEDGGECNWSITFNDALEWLKSRLNKQDEFTGVVVINMADFIRLLGFADNTRKKQLLSALLAAAKDISKSS